MNKEIKEKQQELAQLQHNVEQLKAELKLSKQERDQTDKDKNNGYVDFQKLNHLGQQLKSRDALMSNEGQQLLSSINKVRISLIHFYIIHIT